MRYIKLSHEVVHARYDEPGGKWHVRIRRQKADAQGETEEIEDTADVLLTAFGALSARCVDASVGTALGGGGARGRRRRRGCRSGLAMDLSLWSWCKKARSVYMNAYGQSRWHGTRTRSFQPDSDLSARCEPDRRAVPGA